MKVKVIGSGSNGNCAILTDSGGSQLIIDCGLPYNICARYINFADAIVIITHSHRDHSLIKDKLEMCGLDIFDHSNLVGNEINNINKNWTVIPITVPHGDCPNFSFLIRNNMDNKNIFWATDLESLPRIADKTYDLIAVECNYSMDMVENNYCEGHLMNTGYKNHLPLEKVVEWLQLLTNEPKSFMGIHLSESGNITAGIVKSALKEIVHNIYIAQKGLEFEI